MNEMITALSVKKSQNDMQIICHFDFYSWDKSDCVIVIMTFTPGIKKMIRKSSGEIQVLI